MAAELPSPAGALEAAFRAILQRQMKDVPLLNPALAVEAVGFRAWDGHWLGILITPWFMNLMLLPRLPAAWKRIAVGASRHYRFPAGVFEFIGGHDATLGDYQACSLFSPMFEFANQQGARDTAVAALAAMFDPMARETGEAAPGAAARAAPAPHVLSKRDLLFGFSRRADREP
jgi:[NiFe] hydrogenase assembly HybE family chaperone